MIGERIELWHKEEYHYPAAHGFIPIMVSYIHEDELMHPAMLVVPGGGYRLVSPSEAHLVAMEFYQAGYNVFVLEYTVNPLDEAPLKLQPLKDISRAMRMIRFRAEQLHILSDQIVVCGFSAGGHLCASLCVHGADIEDPDEKYQKFSNKPDAAVLSYPVITSGKYAHRDSFVALLGKNSTKKELEYMSIEKYVTKEIPTCFIWQTETEFHLHTMYFQKAYMECLLQQRTGWNAEEDSLIHRSSFVCLQKRFLREKLHFQRKREKNFLCKMGLEEHSHRNGQQSRKKKSERL